MSFDLADVVQILVLWPILCPFIRTSLVLVLSICAMHAPSLHRLQEIESHFVSVPILVRFPHDAMQGVIRKRHKGHHDAALSLILSSVVRCSMLPSLNTSCKTSVMSSLMPTVS